MSGFMILNEGKKPLGIAGELWQGRAIVQELDLPGVDMVPQGRAGLSLTDGKGREVLAIKCIKDGGNFRDGNILMFSKNRMDIRAYHTSHIKEGSYSAEIWSEYEIQVGGKNYKERTTVAKGSVRVVKAPATNV